MKFLIIKNIMLFFFFCFYFNVRYSDFYEFFLIGIGYVIY